MPQQSSKVREREFLGRTVYSISLPNMQGGRGGAASERMLHYAASGGYVGMSSDAGMLEDYLRSNVSNAKPLRDTPGLAEAAQIQTFQIQDSLAVRVRRVMAPYGQQLMPHPARVREQRRFDDGNVCQEMTSLKARWQHIAVECHHVLVGERCCLANSSWQDEVCAMPSVCRTTRRCCSWPTSMWWRP